MNELQKMRMPVLPLLLKQCEEELENLKKLVRALKVIEQRELYVEQHDDFESYCQHRCQSKLIGNLITKDNK